METQSIVFGDYHIEFANGTLKIICLHNKNNIAVVPSSGNSVIIIPVEPGLTQFKTK